MDDHSHSPEGSETSEPVEPPVDAASGSPPKAPDQGSGAKGQESLPTSDPHPPTPNPPPRHRFKRWLVTTAIVIAAIGLVGSVGVGVTEHHTSQPEFCASCHIMQPYYDSWHADLHGAQLDVACVECHYAPGEQTTLKAKFRGLSQVMSYFSGRYGKTRPRAYVAQASCLTSKCHGNEKFMDKPIQIGTVEFVHATHLNHNEQDEQSHRAALAELTRQLRDRLGEEHYSELRAVAREAGPAAERESAMSDLVHKWNADLDRPTLVKFSVLEHRSVRIDQLRNLQCTNCHAYSAEASDLPGQQQEHHFQVRGSTCYTCHFNNEAFNTGTGKCMLCHTPPQKAITVHEKMSEAVRQKLGTGELGREAVRMDHSEIVARKVECRACHADVVMGDAVVTRRDCERCHDQPRFFADWQEPFRVDLVARYHEVHVPQQRAKCLDCHSEIHHQLAEGAATQRTSSQPASHFLSTAMSQCTQCHPNHHRDQLELLLGRGGETVPHSDSNMMFGARTNCYGCHTKVEQVDGQKVMVATEQACVACHGEEYAQTFQQWKLGLDLALNDALTAYQKARQTVTDATAASAKARDRAEKLLAAAGADLELVKQGGGVHNITYALELLDGVTAHCREAEEAVGQPAPTE